MSLLFAYVVAALAPWLVRILFMKPDTWLFPRLHRAFPVSEKTWAVLAVLSWLSWGIADAVYSTRCVGINNPYRHGDKAHYEFALTPYCFFAQGRPDGPDFTGLETSLGGLVLMPLVGLCIGLYHVYYCEPAPHGRQEGKNE